MIQVRPHKVSDRLFRATLPIDIEDVLNLKELGVNTLIVLETIRPDSSWFWRNRHEFANLKIDVVVIDCPTFGPPNTANVKKFLSLVKGWGTFCVSCQDGKKQTGYMVAAYRLKIQERKMKHAVSEMVTYGFNKMTHFWWLPFLSQYEKAVSRCGLDL